MKITSKAYAKINLNIYITNKRKDGYHDLDMILQTVDLYDGIEIEKINEDKIIIECSDKTLPLDEKNDAYKAAILMKEHFNIKNGYRVKIDKRIPIEAGLGGGSSDAATVINSIVKLENLDTNIDEISKIGLKIGAEMPYSIQGGLKRVRGIGEVVERIDYNHNYYFTIVKPTFSLKTADVFKQFDIKEKINTDLNNDKFILDLENNDAEILDYMHNDLELVSTRIQPEILEIKDKLMELGALKSLMSGSGSSTYGVFDDFNKAKAAADYFNNRGMKAFAVSAI